MPHSVWEKCVTALQSELPSQHFNTWIKPLEVDSAKSAGGELRLVAPNRFVLDWVNSKYLTRIEHLVSEYNQGQVQSIGISVRPKQSMAGRQQRSVVRPLAQSIANPATQHGRSSNPTPPVSAAQVLAKESAESKGGSAQHSHTREFSQVGLTGLDNHTHANSTDDDWANFDWSEVQGAGTSPPVEESNFNPGLSSGHNSSSLAGAPNSNSVNSNGQPIASRSANGLASDRTAPPNLYGGSYGSVNTGHNHHRGYNGAPNTANPSYVTPGVENGRREGQRVQVEGAINHAGGLNTSFTFKSFVEGKSNQLGLAAAQQVAENPGGAYNPLFIYGGVGLGKTHLMHAVGNAIQVKNPNAKVIYLHSERFVADMVKALQLNAINDFKRYYRSVDALLIDDIQFFSGKERSQEEFFHTFNALLEGGQQIILTCDRYPKEIKNVEERLKSRFGWGLTVAVEPPELETRVAILMKKAISVNMDLPNEAAFFIAQRVRSNVRELEGALKRVIAHSHFTRRPIDVPLVTEALKDLLALQSKQVSIDNIQRVVAEYYKIKVSDLHSKRRSRSVARPRQVAMALSKELTNHSLPEIGEAFGGRDHTTVLHACRKIKELREIDGEMQTDVKNLMRLLTT